MLAKHDDRVSLMHHRIRLSYNMIIRYYFISPLACDIQLSLPRYHNMIYYIRRHWDNNNRLLVRLSAILSHVLQKPKYSTLRLRPR